MDDNSGDRKEFETVLRERRPDLVGNPKGVREVISWFDGQIEGLIVTYKDYERFAKGFLENRNRLARYIGDPIKDFPDFKSARRDQS